VVARLRRERNPERRVSPLRIPAPEFSVVKLQSLLRPRYSHFWSYNASSGVGDGVVEDTIVSPAPETSL
jgi:hypothetical protein